MKKSTENKKVVETKEVSQDKAVVETVSVKPDVTPEVNKTSATKKPTEDKEEASLWWDTVQVPDRIRFMVDKYYDRSFDSLTQEEIEDIYNDQRTTNS